MKYEPIKSETDYDLSLTEFASLLGVPKLSWELDRLDALSAHIEQYEEVYYPIDPQSL